MSTQQKYLKDEDGKVFSPITDVESVYYKGQNILCNWIYSTDKVKIGIWTDGSPIYRKVIQTTVGNLDTTLDSLGIKYLLSYYGWIKSNYNNIMTIPVSPIYEAGYRFGMHINTPTNDVVVSIGSYYGTSNNIVLVVEYVEL